MLSPAANGIGRDRVGIVGAGIDAGIGGASKGSSVAYPDALLIGRTHAEEDEAARCGVADSALAWLRAGQRGKGCSVADPEAYSSGATQHIP